LIFQIRYAKIKIAREVKHMTKEEIGSILKELRLKTGKTQKEIAESIGRTQQIIGHWETGYAQPDANTLFTLCEMYGTTVDAAFGFKKAENNSISKRDLDIIRMYNELEPHGKEIVDFALQKEWEHSKSLRQNIDIPSVKTPTRLINYYYRLASAGTGQIIFDMPPTKRIEIPDIPKYKKADYAIGVNGRSMEPVYYDGDMLLVEMTESIEIGEIGIFSVDNECYVKQLGENELISLNPDYGNVPLNETAHCMGRVIDKL